MRLILPLLILLLIFIVFLIVITLRRKKPNGFSLFYKSLKQKFILGAPVVLVIGDKIDIVSEIKGDNWLINEEMGFINFSWFDLENNIRTLFNTLGSKSFNVIVFFIKSQEDITLINNSIKLIFAITGIDCWKFFLMEEDFGSLKEGTWSLYWDKPLEDLENEIIRGFALKDFQEKVPGILKNIEKYGWVKSILTQKTGLFFYGKQKSSLLFLNDFWSKVCYSKASESNFVKSKAIGMQIVFALQSILILTSIILATVFSILLLISHSKSKSLLSSSSTMESLIEQIRFTKMPFNTKSLDNFRNKIEKKIMEMPVDVYKDLFTNPFNTKAYLMCKSKTIELMKLKSVLPKQYIEKIIQIWESFFNFEFYEPFVIIKSINNKISSIINKQDVVKNILDMKNLMVDLKNLQGQNWLFTNWDAWNHFINHLGDVGTILNAKRSEYIENLIYMIKNATITNIGPVFKVDREAKEISFSSDFNDFIYGLEQSTAVNTVSDEKDSILPMSFYFFDLDLVKSSCDIWKEVHNISLKNNFFHFVNRCLCNNSMEKLISRSITNTGSQDLYITSKNTYDAFNFLFPIVTEMKKSGNVDFFNKFINIFQINIECIANSLNSKVYSMFQFIDRINDWNGERLSSFLFDEHSNLFLNKIIDDLLKINSNILQPFIEIINLYSFQVPQYAFIEYMHNQITNFNNNTNDMYKLMAMMRSLEQYLHEWRDVVTPSSNEFFLYQQQYMNFLLAKKTNEIIFFNSLKYFNEIVGYYNENIGPKFPFGNNGYLSYKELDSLVNSYKKWKDKIDANRNKSENMIETIKNIDALCEFFSCKNNMIYYNVSVISDFRDELHKPHNINLLKEVAFEFIDGTSGTSKKSAYQKDTFQCQLRSTDLTNMVISIANSEFEIDTNHINQWFTNDSFCSVVTSKFKVVICGSGNFSLFRIIKHFLHSMNKEGTIIKLQIPLIVKNSHEKAEIVMYVKFEGIPNLQTYFKKEKLN